MQLLSWDVLWSGGLHMSLWYFLLCNLKQLVFKEFWLFCFCLNELSQDFYIVKHFRSQLLRLKKGSHTASAFSMHSGLLKLQNGLFSKSSQIYSGFSAATLSIMSVFNSDSPCSLPSQTTFPAMIPLHPGLANPPPSRPCGDPWEPINPRAKHKGPQRSLVRHL